MLVSEQSNLKSSKFKNSNRNSSNNSSIFSIDSETFDSKNQIKKTIQNNHNKFDFNSRSMYQSSNEREIEIKQNDLEENKETVNIFSQAKNFIKLFSIKKKNQIGSKSKIELNENLKSKKRVVKNMLKEEKTSQLNHYDHRVPFITNCLIRNNDEITRYNSQKITNSLISFQVTLNPILIDLTKFNAPKNYGFTVIGYCPCQIGKVDKETIAEKAGLLPGDLIIKINGKNVSRATCYSIIKILKSKSNQHLVIDLYRCANKSKTNKALTIKMTELDNKKSSCGVLQSKSFDKELYQIKSSKSSDVVNSTECSNNLNRYDKNKKLKSLSTCPKLIENKQFRKNISLKTRFNIHNSYEKHKEYVLKNKSLDLYQKLNILNFDDINHDKKNSNHMNNQYIQNKRHYEHNSKSQSISRKSLSDKELNYLCNKKNIIRLPSPIPYLSPIEKKSNTNVKNTFYDSQYEKEIFEADKFYLKIDENEYHYSTSNFKDMRKSSITDSDYKTQSSATENDAATVYSSVSNICKNKLSIQLKELNFENEQILLSEKILNIEEKFIELMQKGVQQYSRPLRHCLMITPIQHQTLFQNIEKILAISEYQLNQLISQDDSILINMLSTIGKLYENKMRMSYEAFDLYLNGIENSLNLLSLLINPNQQSKTNSISNFSKFVLDSQDDIEIDLKTFLLLPLYYVRDIYLSLKKIKDMTPQNTNDFNSLSNLLSNLELYVAKTSIIVKQFNNDLDKNPLKHSNFSNSFNESLNYNSLGKKKIILHKSNIYLRHFSQKWRKCNMVLLKDRIILVSQNININEYAKHLISSIRSKNITFKNIYLKSIVSYEFSENKLGFKLYYINKNFNNKLCTLKLKTRTNQDQLKWKELLDKYLKK